MRPPGKSARARRSPGGSGGPRVTRVSFINVPSFVLASAIPVTLGGRTIHADVAFGGAFYAIVDAESAGVPIQPRIADEPAGARHADQGGGRGRLHRRPPRRAGAHRALRHDLHGTGADAPGADLRNVTDFRRRRSGPVAVRHRHRAPSSPSSMPWGSWKTAGRSCTRASSARRSAPASPIARASAIILRSFPSSRARPGSPANTRSSLMTGIRSLGDFDCELRLPLKDRRAGRTDT